MSRERAGFTLTNPVALRLSNARRPKVSTEKLSPSTFMRQLRPELYSEASGTEGPKAHIH
jgi:hypothetical protein